MKKLFLTALAFAGALSCFAAGKTEPPSAIKVVVPNGGPAIALSKMAFEKTKVNGVDVDYEIVEGAELLQARILSNEADIAAVPTNLAAILNAKSDAVYVGTIGWGNLYCVSTDASIKTPADLKGKTLYSFGRGMTPDLTAREVLAENGIDAEKDIKIEYLPAVSDVSQAFLAGKAATALIAEPVLSLVLSKKQNAKVVMDVQAEWKKAFGENYPQAGLIVKKDFLKKNKKFIDAFLKEVETSLVWVNANAAEAAEHAASIMTLPPAPIVAAAIPKLNLHFVSAKESRKAFEHYLEVLAKADVKFIGGKMPNEDFYY